MKRRRFVSFIGLASIGALVAPVGCTLTSEKSDYQLTDIQSANLKVLLEIIFPKDDNGPDAKEIGAFDYIVNYIEYKNQKENPQKWFFQGLDDLEQLTQERYAKTFIEISFKKQKEIVEDLLQTKQGENFLSELINLVLESLLAPSIYTDNQNIEGRQWLKVFSGNPQPKKENKFPEILIQLGLE